MATNNPCLAIERRPDAVPMVHRVNGTSAAMIAFTAGAVSAAFLAFGVAGVVALACVLGLLMPIASADLRAAFVAGGDRRARMARRYVREQTLVISPYGRVTHAELTRLVDEIERRDPSRSADLEALLDRHVALIVAHEQAIRAASMADRTQLERIRDSCRADAATDPRRLDLCERRIRCLDDCEAVVESIATELAIVSDTIRLVAQRVACPEAPSRSELIDRELADLDGIDAARRELALLCSDPPAASATPARVEHPAA